MAGRLTRFTLALVLLGSFQSQADAQALYYRSIPIGERAIGLGGTYTAIADDPSASFYNPAGLMDGGRFSILGSLSSIVFTRQTIEQAFDSPLGTQDFESTTSTTLPHFVGTTVKFGKQRFGDHRWAVAYSSFEISRERFGASFTEIEENGSADLRLSDNYRTRYWGVSIATRIKKHVSIGLSAFLSEQSYNYSEDLGLAFGGELLPNGLRVDGSAFTQSTGLGVNTWSFLFRLGALYLINAKWQVGFMFQPPNAPIKQSGGVFRRTTVNTPDESAFFLFDEGDYKTRYPIPFELRVGTRFKINTLTTLTWDVSVHGPVKDRQVFPIPEEVEGVRGGLGAYFANTTQRRWTPNASIGCEHLFGKAVVAGGLFTNISAAPPVPESSDVYRPDQISMFGASLSVGVDTKGYRLTFGATGYFGRGDALAVTVDSDAAVAPYQRTKSNMAGLVLYVAGAVTLASKGAKEVQEKYKERKSRKQELEEQSRKTEGDTSADGEADTNDREDDAEGSSDDPDADSGQEADPVVDAEIQ